MNSTGHSVCPHVTPDWISVLCWLNAKFALLPLPEIHIHTIYPSLSAAYMQWSKISFNKGYHLNVLWDKNDKACLAKLTLILTELDLCRKHRWVGCNSGAVCLTREREDNKTEDQWRDWEMNVMCKTKDVCEEEWAVPVIRHVLSSCLDAYSICVLVSWLQHINEMGGLRNVASQLIKAQIGDIRCIGSWLFWGWRGAQRSRGWRSKHQGASNGDKWVHHMASVSQSLQEQQPRHSFFLPQSRHRAHWHSQPVS